DFRGDIALSKATPVRGYETKTVFIKQRLDLLIPHTAIQRESVEKQYGLPRAMIIVGDTNIVYQRFISHPLLRRLVGARGTSCAQMDLTPRGEIPSSCLQPSEQQILQVGHSAGSEGVETMDAGTGQWSGYRHRARAGHA